MDASDPAIQKAYQDAYQAQMNALMQQQQMLNVPTGVAYPTMAVSAPQVIAPPPGVQASRYNPYGGLQGGSKGKGKGKTKGKPPPQEKPVVNMNQINANKDLMSGGVSFKNILQEKLSKHIHRPLQSDIDISYTYTRVKGGRMCTITLPCLGEGHSYESDRPGNDEKMAGQIASSKALEGVFPEVYSAVMEAYNSAKAELEAGAAAGGEAEAAAAAAATEPKSELNRRINAFIKRPCSKEDVVYETQWDRAAHGYVCTLKLNCLDAGAGTEVYTSTILGCRDQKLAEKDAAKKALEAKKAQFDQALLEQEEKKAKKMPWGGGGKGKGGFPGYGKGKGKGGGGFFVAPSMGFHGAG